MSKAILYVRITVMVREALTPSREDMTALAALSIADAADALHLIADAVTTRDQVDHLLRQNARRSERLAMKSAEIAELKATVEALRTSVRLRDERIEDLLRQVKEAARE